MRAPLRLSCLLMLASFAGCHSSSFVEPAPGDDMLPPLAYYSWLRDAAPGVLAQERERLQANLAAEPEQRVALRQGMLLLAADAEDAALEQAILLSLKEPAPELRDEETTLATLLIQQLELRQQLRQAQRQVATGQSQAQELRAENAHLQEQIDALTSIERQLIERELETLTPADVENANAR